jgi:hypothetical protein
MLILVTGVASLVLWIVLWAIGAKAFDAFMLTAVLVLTAATIHIIWPMLPGNRKPSGPTDHPPYN